MPWAPKRKYLMHAQGSGKTACGKRYGWRLYIARHQGDEVTCQKCIAATKKTAAVSSSPSPAKEGT